MADQSASFGDRCGHYATPYEPATLSAISANPSASRSSSFRSEVSTQLAHACASSSTDEDMKAAALLAAAQCEAARPSGSQKSATRPPKRAKNSKSPFTKPLCPAPPISLTGVPGYQPRQTSSERPAVPAFAAAPDENVLEESATENPSAMSGDLASTSQPQVDTSAYACTPTSSAISAVTLSSAMFSDLGSLDSCIVKRSVESAFMHAALPDHWEVMEPLQTAMHGAHASASTSNAPVRDRHAEQEQAHVASGYRLDGVNATMNSHHTTPCRSPLSNMQPSDALSQQDSMHSSDEHNSNKEHMQAQDALALPMMHGMHVNAAEDESAQQHASDACMGEPNSEVADVATGAALDTPCSPHSTPADCRHFWQASKCGSPDESPELPDSNNLQHETCMPRDTPVATIDADAESACDPQQDACSPCNRRISWAGSATSNDSGCCSSQVLILPPPTHSNIQTNPRQQEGSHTNESPHPPSPLGLKATATQNTSPTGPPSGPTLLEEGHPTEGDGPEAGHVMDISCMELGSTATGDFTACAAVQQLSAPQDGTSVRADVPTDPAVGVVSFDTPQPATDAPSYDVDASLLQSGAHEQTAVPASEPDACTVPCTIEQSAPEAYLGKDRINEAEVVGAQDVHGDYVIVLKPEDQDRASAEESCVLTGAMNQAAIHGAQGAVTALEGDVSTGVMRENLDAPIGEATGDNATSACTAAHCEVSRGTTPTLEDQARSAYASTATLATSASPDSSSSLSSSTNSSGICSQVEVHTMKSRVQRDTSNPLRLRSGMPTAVHTENDSENVASLVSGTTSPEPHTPHSTAASLLGASHTQTAIHRSSAQREETADTQRVKSSKPQPTVRSLLTKQPPRAPFGAASKLHASEALSLMSPKRNPLDSQDAASPELEHPGNALESSAEVSGSGRSSRSVPPAGRTSATQDSRVKAFNNMHEAHAYSTTPLNHGAPDLPPAQRVTPAPHRPNQRVQSVHKDSVEQRISNQGSTVCSIEEEDPLSSRRRFPLLAEFAKGELRAMHAQKKPRSIGSSRGSSVSVSVSISGSDEVHSEHGMEANDAGDDALGEGLSKSEDAVCDAEPRSRSAGGSSWRLPLATCSNSPTRRSLDIPSQCPAARSRCELPNTQAHRSCSQLSSPRSNAESTRSVRELMHRNKAAITRLALTQGRSQSPQARGSPASCVTRIGGYMGDLTHRTSLSSEMHGDSRSLSPAQTCITRIGGYRGRSTSEASRQSPLSVSGDRGARSSDRFWSPGSSVSRGSSGYMGPRSPAARDACTQSGGSRSNSRQSVASGHSSKSGGIGVRRNHARSGSFSPSKFAEDRQLREDEKSSRFNELMSGLESDISDMAANYSSFSVWSVKDNQIVEARNSEPASFPNQEKQKQERLSFPMHKSHSKPSMHHRTDSSDGPLIHHARSQSHPVDLNHVVNSARSRDEVSPTSSSSHSEPRSAESPHTHACAPTPQLWPSRQPNVYSGRDSPPDSGGESSDDEGNMHTGIHPLKRLETVAPEATLSHPLMHAQSDDEEELPTPRMTGAVHDRLAYAAAKAAHQSSSTESGVTETSSKDDRNKDFPSPRNAYCNPGTDIPLSVPISIGDHIAPIGRSTQATTPRPPRPPPQDNKSTPTSSTLRFPKTNSTASHKAHLEPTSPAIQLAQPPTTCPELRTPIPWGGLKSNGGSKAHPHPHSDTPIPPSMLTPTGAPKERSTPSTRESSPTRPHSNSHTNSSSNPKAIQNARSNSCKLDSSEVHSEKSALERKGSESLQRRDSRSPPTYEVSNNSLLGGSAPVGVGSVSGFDSSLPLKGISAPAGLGNEMYSLETAQQRVLPVQQVPASPRSSPYRSPFNSTSQQSSQPRFASQQAQRAVQRAPEAAQPPLPKRLPAAAARLPPQPQLVSSASAGSLRSGKGSSNGPSSADGSIALHNAYASSVNTGSISEYLNSIGSNASNPIPIQPFRPGANSNPGRPSRLERLEEDAYSASGLESVCSDRIPGTGVLATSVGRDPHSARTGPPCAGIGANTRIGRSRNHSPRGAYAQSIGGSVSRSPGASTRLSANSGSFSPVRCGSPSDGFVSVAHISPAAAAAAEAHTAEWVRNAVRVVSERRAVPRVGRAPRRVEGYESPASQPTSRHFAAPCSSD